MRIDHVGHPTKHLDHPGWRRGFSEQGESQKLAKSGDVSSVEAPSQSEAKSEDHVKGVVRLLEQGHFKGVADVRLRINFFDELSQRAAARTAEALPDEAGQLVESVEARVDELLSELEIDPASGEAIEEAVSAFRDEVDGAVAAQAAPGELSLDSLEDALRSAFETLVQRIAEILQPPVESPGDEVADEEPLEVPDERSEGAVDDVGDEDLNAIDQEAPLEGAADTTASQEDATAGTVVDEPVADIPPEPPESSDPLAPVTDPDAPASEDDAASLSVEDALAALQASFDEALSSLLENLQGSLHLGEPSPPNGKGVAYEKFLAIYHELLNGNATPSPEDSQIHETA